MDNKLPEKIYAWNYCGSFNTGLGLPVIDMGDTPWAVYTRAQPKYKRVDFENMRCMGVFTSNLGSNFTRGYNAAIDDIKSKYGDLFIEIKE